MVMVIENIFYLKIIFIFLKLFFTSKQPKKKISFKQNIIQNLKTAIYTWYPNTSVQLNNHQTSRLPPQAKRLLQSPQLKTKPLNHYKPQINPKPLKAQSTQPPYPPNHSYPRLKKTQMIIYPENNCLYGKLRLSDPIRATKTLMDMGD
jgi:hypothetical protein